MSQAENTLTFRVATPEDIPAILPLIQSAYRGDASRAGWTTEADLVVGDRIDHAGVLEKMQEPLGVILLGHDHAGVLTACCEILKREDGPGYFGLFAVDPQRQAGGFGKQVLAAAEAYAKQTMGIERLEMQVIFLRDSLIAWYERRGYVKQDYTRPFPYGQLTEGARALRDDLYFSVLVKEL
ncbi:hypothetical protein S40285_02509 [Stachybotrys chlorohalonatus IBT 40285]|uniref:N-acetyltransferase domain-containing protein n=1 Tax=Stachybotrys chlorohalonatus (strain IBT 40285) TaxID=1283841 RepID=A0A084QWP8_STAC4|nr:hypothetical protein S40285_02509 [Stachybotrys chlorohalonata IBT 40285]